MTVLANKRGAWINQFAQPDAALFTERARQVDYVVIKYGLAFYEAAARAAGVPWVAERMGDMGAGSQNGPDNAELFANQLADQALQPGCIAAVINLEEADGGWHNDDGSATRHLIATFRARAPGVPIFASLDTRGGRPDSPYQVACADECDGLMPMIYPQAFRPDGRFGFVQKAFDDCLNARVALRWDQKEIIATIQTYSSTLTRQDVEEEAAICGQLLRAGHIVGANAYTLGHANKAQWEGWLTFIPSTPAPLPAPPAPDTNEYIAALVALRAAWTAQWTAIADKGTTPEAVALAAWWAKLGG